MFEIDVSFYTINCLSALVSNRITVVLDSGNIEKLRTIQAKMIKSSIKSVSFSHVLNLVLEEGLKKFKS